MKGRKGRTGKRSVHGDQQHESVDTHLQSKVSKQQTSLSVLSEGCPGNLENTLCIQALLAAFQLQCPQLLGLVAPLHHLHITHQCLEEQGLA